MELQSDEGESGSYGAISGGILLHTVARNSSLLPNLAVQNKVSGEKMVVSLFVKKFECIQNVSSIKILMKIFLHKFAPHGFCKRKKKPAQSGARKHRD